MVSEPDIGQYANEDILPKGMACKIPHRLERRTKLS